MFEMLVLAKSARLSTSIDVYKVSGLPWQVDSSRTLAFRG